MKQIFLLAIGLIITPFSVAMAHHPLAGRPMQTFIDGLLSGVGHPILGFDHLFFVLAVGVAALWTSSRALVPLYYVVSMLVGVSLIILGIKFC